MNTNQRMLQIIHESIYWHRLKRHGLDESTFYIFRTDNNAVLKKGIQGFENAKNEANSIRKKYGLRWDQIKFKSERNFGVSRDGKTYTDARGRTGKMDYSPVVNPSKRRRFRGYYDQSGNYHDID